MFRRNKALKNITNAVKSVGAVDLSHGLSSNSFALSEITSYGFQGNATVTAHDPVQSLLAVATSTGEIHLFGHQQIEVVFKTYNGLPITHLRFVKGVYLIAIDTKSEVSVFSLYSKKVLHRISAPGIITAIETDPSLDWLWIGLQSGIIVCYDIDRGMLVRYRLDSLQKQVVPNAKTSAVKSIQWSPRDIGVLLIGYEHAAIVYSIRTGSVKQRFHYEVPANAAGGDGELSSRPRYPKLIHALYHPNSLHALTVHEDNSLVFWDALSGKLLQARTLFDANVNQPQSFNPNASGMPSSPIVDVKWIADQNPEVTSLLVAGGADSPNTLTLIHFGTAPKYSLTSYDYMTSYYSQGKSERFIPLQTQTSSHIVHLNLITRTSPYFASSHHPSHVIGVFGDGSLELLTYPQCQPLSDGNTFPLSLQWSNVTSSNATEVSRKQWLGMISKDTRKYQVLSGGTPSAKHLKPRELRTAIVIGSSTGIVELYDGSKNELEQSATLTLNVSETLNDAVGIALTSYAGDIADLAIATTKGDVVFYRFAINPSYNPSLDGDIDTLNSRLGRFSLSNVRTAFTDLKSQCPNVKEGLLPLSLLHLNRGKVTALANSNLHFISVAYDSGDLVIVDRRGPAIIFNDSILTNSSTGSSFITSLKFSIMSYGDDQYSSVLLFAGTDKGEVFIYKVVPESNGRFKGQLVDIINHGTNDEVKGIHPIKAETGTPCVATSFDFDQLSSGHTIKGLVLIQSKFDLKIYTPGKSKSATSHKVFKTEVYAAGVSVVGLSDTSKASGKGFAVSVPVVLSDGSVRIHSLPELKEISSIGIPYGIIPQFAKMSSVLASGEILLRTGPRSGKLITVIPTAPSHATDDKLFSEHRLIPARPTIAATQWFKGDKPLTEHELESILTNNQRHATKNQESQIASNMMNHSILATNKISPPSTPATSSTDEFKYHAPVRGRTQGGYDPSRYVVRQFNEGVDSIGGTVEGYINGISNSVNDSLKGAKEDLVAGVIKSKFGI